jgi:hypothetical protein
MQENFLEEKKHTAKAYAYCMRSKHNNKRKKYYVNRRKKRRIFVGKKYEVGPRI